jgi:hypothetical protein
VPEYHPRDGAAAREITPFGLGRGGLRRAWPARPRLAPGAANGPGSTSKNHRRLDIPAQEHERTATGGFFIWIDRATRTPLDAERRPADNCSDTIIRLEGNDDVQADRAPTRHRCAS